MSENASVADAMPCCNVVCVSGGVMYWGDAKLDKIETAYINGTGRKTLQTENADYYDFLLHDGDIYFTDWKDQ